MESLATDYKDLSARLESGVLCDLDWWELWRGCPIMVSPCVYRHAGVEIRKGWPPRLWSEDACCSIDVATTTTWSEAHDDVIGSPIMGRGMDAQCGFGIG